MFPALRTAAGIAGIVRHDIEKGQTGGAQPFAPAGPIIPGAYAADGCGLAFQKRNGIRNDLLFYAAGKTDLASVMAFIPSHDPFPRSIQRKNIPDVLCQNDIDNHNMPVHGHWVS